MSAQPLSETVRRESESGWPSLPSAGGGLRTMRHERRKHDRKALLRALIVSTVIAHISVIPVAGVVLQSKRVKPKVERAGLTPTGQASTGLRALDLEYVPVAKTEKRSRPRQKRRRKPDIRRRPNRRLRAVEVTNPESERPPEDARFISDKNRRVDQNMRARIRTRAVATQRAKPTVERTKAALRPNAGEAHRKKRSVPRRSGAKKEGGGMAVAQGRQGALALSSGKDRFGPGSGLATGPELGLDHYSLDAIDGSAAREARDYARRHPIPPPEPTHHHKKWRRVRAALDNFLPDVKTGNQTALGTRADPFAVYIARMHRKIHPLWGDGFISDLETKLAGGPLDNRQLNARIEIVVTPVGKVKKATIVKPSGQLAFDASALDVVFSAAPFLQTPQKIRSSDGNVYLHWNFHRDHRQCGTFGVDTYILTQVKPLARSKKPAEGGAHPAFSTLNENSRGRESGGALRRVLRDYFNAFTRGDARAMVALSMLPFLSRGKIVAREQDSLYSMYRSFIAEHKKRKTRIYRIMSPAAARKARGFLPKGMRYGAKQRIVRAEIAGRPFLVLLSLEKGRWRVFGLRLSGESRSERRS